MYIIEVHFQGIIKRIFLTNYLLFELIMKFFDANNLAEMNEAM